MLLQPRLYVAQLERGPDLSHRKSATTAGASNEHPSRVLPATTRRSQPRFFHSSRPRPRPGLGDGEGAAGRLSSVCAYAVCSAAERGWSGGGVSLGRCRPGPGDRSGRVASWSGCPPRRCCALSGWGPAQRWRRQGAAAALGRQRARTAVGGPPWQVLQEVALRPDRALPAGDPPGRPPARRA